MYMFSALLFFLLQVSSILSENDVERSDGRIVGGVAVNITDYPYQISLEHSGSHLCGGSIITRMWILSAAHCVTGTIPWRFTVRAGSSIRGDGGQVRRVIWTFRHPRYRAGQDDYDYALVRIINPLVYGVGVQPIAIATSIPAAGTQVTVSGWGAMKSGATSFPTQLQAVNVSMIDWTECNKDYNNTLTNRMICAASIGKDSCQGDSGGPLVWINGTTRQQIGVVSFGEGCADINAPGVYSNLAAVQTWLKIILFIP